MSTFRIPDDKVPAGTGVPFSFPQYPSGTDAMSAAPATPLQKCGLAQSDTGSMWKRLPGDGCTAFSPDLSDHLTLPVGTCAGMDKAMFPMRDPMTGAPLADADLTYKYAMGGCEGGWDVGAWGARQPSAGSRLGISRAPSSTRSTGAPKHYQK